MPNHLQVVKSNHIISASYRLSVTEQRIILCCIAQVRRDAPITDEVLYSVKATDLAELCGTDLRRAYRDLAEAAQRLYERQITIQFEPDGKPRPHRKQLTRWVQDVVYIEGEGRIELRFGKTILPFITGLTEHFTRYSLSAVAKMSSAHGIRLYELLMQYSSVGEREITIEQLQEWLQLQGQYALFSNLKRRVIEPAIEQINEHSPLAVKWEQRKTGRKVTAILFTFKTKKQSKGKAGGMAEAEMAAQARPGESWDQLKARLKCAHP